MATKYPKELEIFIAHLRKLPGVGTKTAERFAFELIGSTSAELHSFSQILALLHTKLPLCKECRCLTDAGVCSFCDDKVRDLKQLCLIASPRDAFSIESTSLYRGLYHVVEHLLSPLDGRHAEQLNVGRIEERILRHKVQEVILAFDSTLEGDATALYLKERLAHLPIAISRLAFGLPVGGSLEYIDSGTLARSFKGRQAFAN